MKTARCEGPITRGSAELKNDPGLIGCHDAARITEFLDYLREHRRVSICSSQHCHITLPRFIPVLESGMPQGTSLLAERIYGVYLKSVLNRYGNFKYKSGSTLRRGLRLPERGRLALFLSATDSLIERAWEFSRIRDLWKRLAAMGFEFVTSATFSVYEEDPRSDQIFNQDRNFHSYELFCELAVPCIPFLFFNPSSDRDYQSILTWLRRHHDVTKVAVLAHCYRGERAFERMLTQSRSIVTDIDRPLQFVFVGVAKLDRIRQILSQFPDATFVTPQPVAKARVGELTMRGLQHVKVGNQISRAQLLAKNIQQFDSEIDAEIIKRSTITLRDQLLLPFVATTPRN